MELVNQDPSVKNYTYTLFSRDTCASVPGQIALDLMANPPQPGDPSYPLYNEVRGRRAFRFCDSISFLIL